MGLIAYRVPNLEIRIINSLDYSFILHLRTHSKQGKEMRDENKKK